MKYNLEKGVSLLIAFLILTLMLAAILGISTILFNKIKTVGNIGSSVSAFNAANAGVEKTLYFDRKQIPVGATRGFCNICNVCNDCQDCLSSPLAAGGCDVTSCANCQVTYNSAFDNRTYNVDAKVTPNPQNPTVTDIFIGVKGFYNNVVRTDYFSGNNANPVPFISSISPTNAEVGCGGAPLDLTVNGTGFIPSSVVRFNGLDRVTTFISKKKLTAVLPPSDCKKGSFPITVFNPSPGGGTSNAVNIRFGALVFLDHWKRISFHYLFVYNLELEMAFERFVL